MHFGSCVRVVLTYKNRQFGVSLDGWVNSDVSDVAVDRGSSRQPDHCALAELYRAVPYTNVWTTHNNLCKWTPALAPKVWSTVSL